MDVTNAVDSIDRATALDAVAEPLAQAAGRVVRGGAKDALQGRWMGHPLHPVLTDVAIGCWSSANVLDVIGGRKGRASARRLMALGVLSAVPTAAAGLADWLDGDEEVRRTGVVHAALNTVALTLYFRSWRARRREQWLRGAVLGLAGTGVATASGYLGGHLTYRLGSRVEEARDLPEVEELPVALPNGAEASMTGVRL